MSLSFYLPELSYSIPYLYHMQPPELRSVAVTRYVTPLREGGSLPAIVEADDDFPYVIKFRGAGQGKKALIAELIGGEMARMMGLRVPELVFMDLDDSFARLEPDEEIQDLLKFSIGLNLGLHYLSGAITYDPAVSEASPEEASLVVLLDSMITNIDRTHRNPNLLNWNRELWLIDHGAALYFHHAWTNWEAQAARSFPPISNHVLLDRASELEKAEATILELLTHTNLSHLIDLIPEEWLEQEGDPLPPLEKRKAYLAFLLKRLELLPTLRQEAQHARNASI